jgi:hypothetical protein
MLSTYIECRDWYSVTGKLEHTEEWRETSGDLSRWSADVAATQQLIPNAAMEKIVVAEMRAAHSYIAGPRIERQGLGCELYVFFTALAEGWRGPFSFNAP